MLLWALNIISDLSFLKYNIICSTICRGVISLFFALFITLGIGKYVIRWLIRLNLFQSIRFNGPVSHLSKGNTPTMGGIIILVSMIASIIMWSDLSNLCVWYVLYIVITYGLLGLIDDLLKIRKDNSSGLSMLNKYFWQSVFALILVIIVFVLRLNDIGVLLTIPLFKNAVFQLNFWAVLLAYFIIVGMSNSVNLSDGLDGLAIVLIISVVFGLILIAGISSNLYFSNYFHVSYIGYVKELVVVCASIIGAGLGFLWFNTYPARIFMGDTGSLSLGGAIGVIAVLLKQEYLILIMGGVFVIESLSVILQVSSFKIFKKRIFKMAPIHHHFELNGSSEPKIVVRFWIVSLILVLIGLMLLKIR